jgi:hypothetical protein
MASLSLSLSVSYVEFIALRVYWYSGESHRHVTVTAASEPSPSALGRSHRCSSRRSLVTLGILSVAQSLDWVLYNHWWRVAGGSNHCAIGSNRQVGHEIALGSRIDRSRAQPLALLRVPTVEPTIARPNAPNTIASEYPSTISTSNNTRHTNDAAYLS